MMRPACRSVAAVVGRKSVAHTRTSPPADRLGQLRPNTQQRRPLAAEAGETESPAAAPEDDMVSVTYRGNTFRVPKGTKLRTALLKNQLSPHNGRATLINCRGLGTCGTCAVEIKAAAQTGALPVAPAAWTAQERLRLNFPPHKPPGNQRLRLACQVSCQGDLEVLKRDQFWGQGEDVLGEVAPSDDLTWFGPLEFVLDPNAGALPDKKSNGQDGK